MVEITLLKRISKYTMVIGIILILLSLWNAHYFKEFFISGVFFIIYSLIIQYIDYDIKKEKEKGEIKNG